VLANAMHISASLLINDNHDYEVWFERLAPRAHHGRPTSSLHLESDRSELRIVGRA
jgi:hypothetical protein